MALGTPGNGLGSGDPINRNSGNNSIGGGIPARGQGDVYLDQGIENDLGACYKNLVNYGLILPAYGLQWRDEVLNFLSSPNTTKIAEFDELSLNVILDVRNTEVASTGQKYKLNCSSYLFKDYCNNITAINYSGVSSFDVSLAKFTFGGLPGEWYVRNGQLCKLEMVSTFDNRSPNLGDNPYPNQPPPSPPPPAPLLGAGQCYVPLYADDVIDSEELITAGMWCSSSATATSSLGNTSETMHYHTYETDDYDRMDSACDYILDVYNSNPSTDSCAKIQYKIVYGDYYGYGTTDLGGLDSETLTKAMYSQYANILLPKGQEKFIISGSEEDYVYIIDVERSRYNLSMDPGNWELTLTALTIPNSYANISSSFADIMINSTIFSGSTSTGSVIDSSWGTDVHLTNQVYDVVAGTLELGPTASGALSEGKIIGNFYPNHGIIVLAGSKMQGNFFNTNRTQNRGRNTLRLLRSMNLSATANPMVDASGDYKGFKARSINKRYNKLYFIRVKNQQLNYSNNPTYQISGSSGTIITDFKGIEKAYFTTVGLYNQNKELLAVGKVSQATLSSATEETLFTVKVSL